ncbi:MAG: prolyl aminopeptidase [Spongiibacteraceae bacterium]|jgi:proline iminopeptidase|nr:prolyl aminopeptidase [Spongiibacteraceae bacterium]
MRSLYPDIKPYATHRLPVDGGHVLYVEECGSPDGIPVLFVHGGPGGGCTPKHRCFFDPMQYRIILFDQRGCGRSTPHAELGDNNTEALIQDMERIRTLLGVDRWVLFGGSWGSTLSLVYAERFPGRVRALILRGIFLCRRADLLWFYQEGASRIFADHWQQFIAPVPVAERGDLLRAYYRLLTGSNELARMAAAKAWSGWEALCSTLRPDSHLHDQFTEPRQALAMARIEAHYFVNDGFLRPSQILEDAHRLADIPGVIIHGRYDMVCPFDQAFALQEAWPQAELQLIRDAGHSALEPGITDALVRATDRFARIIQAES